MILRTGEPRKYRQHPAAQGRHRRRRPVTVNEDVMSSSTHPAPTSLRAQAYESFQQQIVDANIRPGQFVSQRELMQLLGMPLGAVRELIPRLEAEGLLKTVPQRGLQIAHVDLKLINNAFQLRLLLERRRPAVL
ncbi:GntR family transcriptional regulator [Polaromonas sp. P2-4]|nr:GntR family transcriptional regulator [Polaromonas sp. P2-4]